jgi:N-acyl-D-aspartate/D-glutamate deacylase
VAEFDLIIRSGTVFDGTGRPGFPADVGVRGDRIEAVGNLAGAVAAREIDAAGRYVAPGFIDIHTHSDWAMFGNPRMESKIRQGVTTEVAGNCGTSLAPSPESAGSRTGRPWPSILNGLRRTASPRITPPLSATAPCARLSWALRCGRPPPMSSTG